jgi:iron complex outermembrane receptor protein
MTTLKTRLAVSVSALSVGVLFAGSIPSVAFAQGSGTSFAIEEITVTARKREETVQDIPLSITAFSADAIEKAAIFDVRDVAKLAPNVTLQTTGGAGTGRFMPNLTFRGLQNVFPTPRAQVGAVFLDGNYVLGGVNAVNTADVERVEVLRGPQNAYFGRNTFAGAINFITKTPGDEFKGTISASGSTRGSYDINASAEGPLVEGKLAGRASVLQKDKRGHYVAKDGGRLGNESTQAVATTLYATPTDNLNLRLRGSWQEDDDGPGQVINLSPSLIGDTCQGRRINKGQNTAGVTGFNVSLPYFCGSIPGIKELGEGIVSTNTSLRSPLLASVGNPNALINGFINNNLGDGQVAKAPSLDALGLKRQMRAVDFQSEYEFDNGITFAFNYGWQDNQSALLSDSDRTDIETTYSYIPQFTRTQSFEVRVTSDQEQSIRWLAGAAHFKSHFASNFGNGGSLQYRSRTLPTQAFSTAVVTSLSLGANPFGTNEVATVKSLFAAVDWDIFDEFTLSGELRYQEDASVSGAQLLPTFPTIPTKLTFKDYMPRVIGTYHVSDDWNLYASWSRGVLPGVDNTGFTSQTAFRQNLLKQIIPDLEAVLDSDQLDNYEVGSKQTLLDGQLQYNLSAYYMKWKNAKASTALVLPATSETNPTPFTVAGVTTQGTVAIRGVEFETSLRVTQKWDIGGGVAVQKSKFLRWGEAGLLRDLTGGQSAGAVVGNANFGATQWKGNEMQRQPRATGNLNTTFRDSFNDTWEWFVRGDMTYTGKAWDSTANIVKSEDYFRVNARIGVEREDVTLEIYSTNLFNDKTWDYVSRTAIGDLRNNSSNAILPLGNAGLLQGFAVQAPDKRDFGARVKYKF